MSPISKIRWAKLSALLGLALLVTAPALASAAPLTAHQKILQALNRAAFGPRPGEVAKVQQMGLDNWLNAQLNPETISDSKVNQQLSQLTYLQMPIQELLLSGVIDRSRVSRKLADDKSGKVPLKPKRKARLLKLQQIMQQKGLHEGGSYVALGELINAKLLRAIESPRQLQEVLVNFWSNHFNLDAKKGQVRMLLIKDQKDVIRPHVLGKFRDLLEASAKSPAMLDYLDNASSRVNPDRPAMATQQRGKRWRRRHQKKKGGFQKASYEFVAPPGSNPAMTMPAKKSEPNFIKNPAQQGNKGKGGLNENYGREVMELHTLGVNGGYTQEDVINVARCFTGWTYNKRTGDFVFKPYLHDNGTKTVLGHVIAPGGGIKDGEKVIDILASSPATAQHLSYELCQRFVSDNPPPQLVKRVAGVWMETDGDLKAVTKAILTSPEFNSTAAYQAKIKSPFEYVVSAVRALDGEMMLPQNPQNLWQTMFSDGRISGRQGFRGGRGAASLAQQVAIIGQPLFSCQPPTGYTGNSQEWVSSGALIARLNFALSLASNDLQNVFVSPSSLLENVNEESADAVESRLVMGILHRPLTAATKQTIDKETVTNGLVNRRKLTALLLGSPEFQRR